VRALQVRFLPIGGVATQAHTLRFSSDGRYLVVLDAYTRAVMQYKLRPVTPEPAPVIRVNVADPKSTLVLESVSAKGEVDSKTETKA
jgi:hypothetical protein